MRPIRLSTLLFFLQVLSISAANAQASLQFADLENKLLNANELSLDFHVTASGAIQVNIEGSLRKTASGDISLSASGIFAGQAVDLIATRNGNIFEYGNRQAPAVTDPPRALWEALVIGFTRMGILHNIANLTAGALPDHAEGGVSDWVLASNVSKLEESFTFDVIVNDTLTGLATLVFDEFGNPELRQQSVAFPSGEMRVVETYTNISRSE